MIKKSYFSGIAQMLMAVLVAVLLVGIFIYAHKNGVDFKVYYLAGQRLLQHLPIYQFADGWSPFKYHPAWAVIFSFFSLWSYTVANLLFNIINLSFWIMTAILWARWLNIRMSIAAWTILLIISINALSTEIGFGQVNGFLIWGVTWLFQQIEEKPKSYWRMGMLAALIITLKLNYSLILVYLLMRQWRILWGLGLGFVLLHLLAMVGFRDLSVHNLYNVWIQLLLTQSADQFNTFEVQGFFRYLLRHFDLSMARWIWLSFLALAIGLGLGAHRLRNQNYFVSTLPQGYQRALSASYWLAIIFFFSPLSWWYHILFLYPMAIVLLYGPLPKIFKFPVIMIILVFSTLSFNVVGEVNLIRLKDSMIFFTSGFLLLCISFSARVYWCYGAKLTAKSNAIVESEIKEQEVMLPPC